MYLREGEQFLKNQISVLSEPDDFLFQSVVKSLQMDPTAFQTYSMQYSYFHGIYTAVRLQAFLNRDCNVLYNEDSKHLPRSFVVFLEVCSDKTA